MTVLEQEVLEATAVPVEPVADLDDFEEPRAGKCNLCGVKFKKGEIVVTEERKTGIGALVPRKWRLHRRCAYYQRLSREEGLQIEPRSPNPPIDPRGQDYRVVL